MEHFGIFSELLVRVGRDDTEYSDMLVLKTYYMPSSKKDWKLRTTTRD